MIRPLSFVAICVLALAPLSLSACGGGRRTGGSDGGRTADGGGVADGAVPRDARVSADGAIPAGNTCSFTRVDGASRVTWTGTLRARMNGSANLLMVCESAAGGDEELELLVGNATFDGARVYRMDDFSSDGSIYYHGESGALYASDGDGGSCTVDVTEAAPLDARGDSVIVGGRVAGTFACAALVGRPEDVPSQYVVESGVFSAIVE